MFYADAVEAMVIASGQRAMAKASGPRDLLSCTSELVFFGTPFCGSGGALGECQIEHVLRERGVPVTGGILSVLQLNKDILNENLETFTNHFVAGDVSSLRKIVCFYETQKDRVRDIVEDGPAVSY